MSCLNHLDPRSEIRSRRRASLPFIDGFMPARIEPVMGFRCGTRKSVWVLAEIGSRGIASRMRF
jgi:hypothetical protein